MTIDLGDVLGRTIRLLRVSGVRAALTLAILAGLGWLIDSGTVTAPSFNLVVSGAILGAQYWLTRALLEELGFPLASRPRGWAFIGLGIVTGLAIALGFVLLVIPGLILFTRWSIATPGLLSSDEGVFDCMQRSWDQTKGHFWPIFVAFIVVYLPAFGIFAGTLALYELGQGSQSGVVIGNLAMNAALIGGWHASVAIFSLLNNSPAVAEVFE